MTNPKPARLVNTQKFQWHNPQTLIQALGKSDLKSRNPDFVNSKAMSKLYSPPPIKCLISAPKFKIIIFSIRRYRTEIKVAIKKLPVCFLFFKITLSEANPNCPTTRPWIILCSSLPTWDLNENILCTMTWLFQNFDS